MRLFVTVGTQFPFDRLVRTVDEWVGRHCAAGVEAFAQVGPSAYRPRHMGWAAFVDAPECERQSQLATAVVAHAGMGSIITALQHGKPIIVMPRRAELGEHRNDHQLATARSLLSQGKLTVAMDEAHLAEKLEHLDQLIASSRRVGRHASPHLIAALRQFIATGERPAAPLTDGVALARVAVLARDRATLQRIPDEAAALSNG